MKKLALLCLFFSGFALSGFGQTKERLHKAVTDPSRDVNAAKADVYIQDKTIITEKGQKRAAQPATGPKKGACSRKKVCCKKG